MEQYLLFRDWERGHQSEVRETKTRYGDGGDHKKRRVCPACGPVIECQDQRGGIKEQPGLPAGVKFDPTDQELLKHLEGKVQPDLRKPHRLIDEFIPVLEGENGICCAHPEKLPGVTESGQIRHFFHRPSKAYTTGNRKRRKVRSDNDDGETRWHKTGKTRPVFVKSQINGYKKILVLYTNYGKQKKPEETNWVMHQYHLGNDEEEKEGDLVVSKVFYQTQPRECGTRAWQLVVATSGQIDRRDHQPMGKNRRHSNPATLVDYYNSSSSHISFEQEGSGNSTMRHFATTHGGSSCVL
ncbi:hypothetical protein MLD38_033328 [Melastoma candidum]|uniref:Uncharacterized protein n=1 Tax=Melastoma candidum TaxID=119954 RepID=A0ACB9M6E7_9MYRT|nr:hypothetical protein MLD38_033328 [Melastoma candidum]